jgi:short-subunit dehydrogenase
MKSFEGKHAVVTGAASGIGAATAVELARRGADVTLVDIDEVGARRTAAAVDALGVRADVAQCDLSDAAQTEAFCAAMRAKKPVDVLVSNAGIAVVAPFSKTTDHDWDRLLEINLRSALRLTRAFVPDMVERGRGNIVFVASLAGLLGAPGMVGYSTSKFALVGFAEALRHDLAGTGVSITTVCPGYVRTNLHANTRYENDGFKRFLDDPPALYGMKSEAVAVKLCNAMLAKRALMVLGPEKIGWWLKRIAPEAAHVVTGFVQRKTGIGAGAPQDAYSSARGLVPSSR